ERFLEVGLGFTPVQLALEADTEGPEEAGEDCLDERLLGAEVVVHRSQIDPSLAGDQAKRSLGEALFRKELFRCIKNPLHCFRLRHAPSDDKHLFETYVSPVDKST